MTTRFPQLAARDLERRARTLPADFSGEPNLVIVAFRREQQAMVDTWVSWFATIAAQHPRLACYEVPVIATRWSPARPMIDGGMAQAVRASEARRRTLTVYTDVRRVTDALSIDDTETITVLLVDTNGHLLWRTTGPVTERATSAVLELLAETHDDPPAAPDDTPDDTPPAIEQFEFEFDPRFRPLLALMGVTPGTAHVTLTPDHLVVRFGPWACQTPTANIRDICRTGPFHWYKAIGARGSLADRGLTFGTNATAGVCVLFDEPVRGLIPLDSLRHPGLTLTLAEPDRFVASLHRRIGTK